MSAYPAYVIGSLCIVGGVAGFARRRSVPSLLGGVSVGLLYLYGADAIRKGAPNGLEAACAASALLLISSLPRATKGPVPAMLALLATGAGAYYGRAYYALR
ncbi:putative transmembrane proteins 14C [Lyophyllum shimeji]|uniref:Transmembrane proteins 14C n=1 Tax=Lyophyllum shimeji TaxID=47721 RepID=A0A9P3PU49_LYOSH|nr:putative transmembrane proteins 14C [Lyophyllum shimeji]